MKEVISRYPLQWPDGWKRMPAYQRKAASFSKNGKRLSVFDGVERVLGELKLLGVSDNDVVISTNVETRLDGLPRSDRATPQDVGVAVYWVTRRARRPSAWRWTAMTRWLTTWRRWPQRWRLSGL
jgi:hypothetical protein